MLTGLQPSDLLCLLSKTGMVANMPSEERLLLGSSPSAERAKVNCPS